MTLKILDFGIAAFVAGDRTAATATTAIGSPLWIAPEQTHTGAMLRPATDVWALGLIAFYLLTGRSYWPAANAEAFSMHALLAEILAHPLVRASERAAAVGGSIPAEFDAWFARCVVRAPEDRFADARAAVTALRTLTGAQPEPVAPAIERAAPTARLLAPTEALPSATPPTRAPLLAMIGAGTLALATLAFAITFYRPWEATGAADRPETAETVRDAVCSPHPVADGVPLSALPLCYVDAGAGAADGSYFVAMDGIVYRIRGDRAERYAGGAWDPNRRATDTSRSQYWRDANQIFADWMTLELTRDGLYVSDGTRLDLVRERDLVALGTAIDRFSVSPNGTIFAASWEHRSSWGRLVGGTIVAIPLPSGPRVIDVIERPDGDLWVELDNPPARVGLVHGGQLREWVVPSAERVRGMQGMRDGSLAFVACAPAPGRDVCRPWRATTEGGLELIDEHLVDVSALGRDAGGDLLGVTPRGIVSLPSGHVQIAWPEVNEYLMMQVIGAYDDRAVLVRWTPYGEVSEVGTYAGGRVAWADWRSLSGFSDGEPVTAHRDVLAFQHFGDDDTNVARWENGRAHHVTRHDEAMRLFGLDLSELHEVAMDERGEMYVAFADGLVRANGTSPPQLLLRRDLDRVAVHDGWVHGIDWDEVARSNMRPDCARSILLRVPSEAERLKRSSRRASNVRRSISSR